MLFMEIFQLDCYAVPELPPSRNPLHNCIGVTENMIYHYIEKMAKIPTRNNNMYTWFISHQHTKSSSWNQNVSRIKAHQNAT